MSNSSNNDWQQILKGKWKPFNVEKSLYVDSENKANSVEEKAKIICDGLREGEVPENLHKIYKEAVYESNEKVRSRVISRVYFIGRTVR